jgi:hypothetical protein
MNILIALVLIVPAAIFWLLSEIVLLVLSIAALLPIPYLRYLNAWWQWSNEHGNLIRELNMKAHYVDKESRKAIYDRHSAKEPKREDYKA